MPICPYCGSQQPDEAAFCDECGVRLDEGTRPAPGGVASAQPAPAAGGTTTCPECGAWAVLGEAFCDNCGAALNTAAPAPAQPAPVVALDLERAGPLICANCGAQLEAGSNFCDMCGTPVPEVPPTPWAGPEPAQQRPYTPAAPLRPAQPAAAAVQGRLVVRGTSATLPFPPARTEFIIGREDPVSGIFPEIDLTDHGGDEGGVSREHARITIQGFEFLIEDLQSTNFTYVNQQRLTPGQPHPLKDGDEVRLGRVKLTFRT